MRPLGILPVQKGDSAYHVAALNNLYARAADPERMNDGSSKFHSTDAHRADTLPAGGWEARLSEELLSIQALADEVDGEPQALLLLGTLAVVAIKQLPGQLPQEHSTILRGR